jgi:nicotinamidase-related amidase
MNTDQSLKTALLVIDVQNGLFNKNTPIYKANELLNTIHALVNRAHQAGVLVVYIQHSDDRMLVWGTPDWQIHPYIQPSEGDLRIHKKHGNAFEGTPLETELRTRGIQRLVMTGLVTHGCVKATCLGGRELGYPVVLVQDGHSSFSKDAARLIVEWNEKLAGRGVQLCPAADISL